MNLTVNGKPQESDAANVLQLIQELGLNDQPVAVERNGQVVRWKTYEQTMLSEGDTLEIVTLVGGG